ncbi:helix-turn-helix domain-containing protein [Aneurinibacillus danicus]|jgi:transcriptional regulator with XRE-family HTH domain|uniref:HTH cro/C1-type domain-containing protein n=1 Tax=Aneurinibacillus danicus TaxID=267746 RepID=A0A511VA52_9BACL|nr:helix-turn-helix domain-containing protein [Aneurinibacillus danicus]GEN35794.1 hypothetical protein ADA01nite_32540 [Aneurinibacillus danicus]
MISEESKINEFAARLLKLRKDSGKKQQEIADYLKISRPAYASYEVGRRKPDLIILEKLSDYFKVSVDFLLGKEAIQVKMEVENKENKAGEISREDEIRKCFGERMAKLRRDKKISQEAFAKEFNISLFQVQQLEYGVRMPSLELLVKIADFFSTSIDYLLGRHSISQDTKTMLPNYGIDITPELIDFILELQSDERGKKLIEDMSNDKKKINKMVSIWEIMND